VQQRLSLDEHLVQHRESTFFMRVGGDSMRDLGIFDGDLLGGGPLRARHPRLRSDRRGGRRIHREAVAAHRGRQGAACGAPGLFRHAYQARQDFSIWVS